MLNQVIAVGRIVKDVEKREEEDGRTYAEMTIAVPRSFKNEDGEYDTDFIDCILWNGVADNVAEYCRKGDLVGVKGRIRSTMHDGYRTTDIVAEKVTFLSNSKGGNEDE